MIMRVAGNVTLANNDIPEHATGFMVTKKIYPDATHNLYPLKEARHNFLFHLNEKYQTAAQAR